MEVHPILGRGDTPQPCLWYVISSYGQYPSMRVGHTITYVPGRDGKADKLVIIGGANPSGPFAETHILYLDKYEWDELECDGLIGRYEHCAFLPESQPNNIYIFGGADQANNLNDMQMLNLATEKWSTVSVSGTPPSSRTCRNSACLGNKLYVFGGGGEKSEPVNDRSLHVFDAESLTWSQPEVKGKVPKPRLGHVMVAVGNKIYLHGGMARDIFYNELHELNTEIMTWKLVRCKGDVPQGCTAHAAVAISNTQFCIQGGMTPGGALDSTYVFDTASARWKKMKFECPPPACRLDHAICFGYLTTHPKSNPESSSKPEVKTEETASSDKNGDAGDGGKSGRKEGRGSVEASDKKERTNDEGSFETGRTPPSSEPQADGDGTSETQSIAPSVVESTPGESKTDSKDNGETEKTIHSESKCDSNPVENGQQSVVQESQKQRKENTSQESNDASAATAEALTSTLTTEGDKQVPPSLTSTAQASDNQNADSDTIADALTSLSIEGSKQDTPSASTTQDSNTTADALASLLSIEGAKQVLSGRQRDSESTAADVGSSESVKSLVCVIHGGMDTGGEIFDDCLVWRVDVSL